MPQILKTRYPAQKQNAEGKKTSEHNAGGAVLPQIAPVVNNTDADDRAKGRRKGLQLSG